MKTKLLILALALAAAAQAQVVQWSSGIGNNGHYYELVLAPAGISWLDAKAAAEAKGGYLATITTSAEGAFVYALAAGDDAAWFIDAPNNGLGPWLGGYQAPASAEPAGGWSWVTGETWSYTNWASGEPSDYAGLEDRLQFFGSQTLKAATWNDLPSGGNADGPARSYLIEYESAPLAAVPEPAAWAAVAGVLALLRRAYGGQARRRFT